MNQPASFLIDFCRFLTAVMFIGIGPVFPASLQEMLDTAGPGNGYDRYVVLETGITYTGGLMTGVQYNPISHDYGGICEDIFVEGNGAVLDLQGQQILVSSCESTFDLENCVILNGNIRFRGSSDDVLVALPSGSIRYVTFYQPHDYCIRLQNAGPDITIEHNLLVDAVDTGPDFVTLTGYTNSWLPTGVNIALSGQFFGFYGPFVRDNWSFHTDPTVNADSLRHFGFV